MSPLLVSHYGGLAGRIFLSAGNPRPFPSSCPMAASCNCCNRVLRGVVCRGAPAGRCAPWFVFCAASLRFPCRYRQKPSGFPCPPRGVGILLQRLLLCILSPPIGAFSCDLLRAATARTVLPPYSFVSPAHRQVFYHLSPPARLCRRPRCLLCHLLICPLHGARHSPYVPVSPPCPPAPTFAVPRDSASARAAPCASSPSPGLQYRP